MRRRPETAIDKTTIKSEPMSMSMSMRTDVDADVDGRSPVAGTIQLVMLATISCVFSISRALQPRILSLSNVPAKLQFI